MNAPPAVGTHFWSRDDGTEYLVIEFNEHTQELTYSPVDDPEAQLTTHFSAPTFWDKYRDS